MHSLKVSKHNSSVPSESQHPDLFEDVFHLHDIEIFILFWIFFARKYSILTNFIVLFLIKIQTSFMWRSKKASKQNLASIAFSEERIILLNFSVLTARKIRIAFEFLHFSSVFRKCSEFHTISMLKRQTIISISHRLVASSTTINLPTLFSSTHFLFHTFFTQINVIFSACFSNIAHFFSWTKETLYSCEMDQSRWEFYSMCFVKRSKMFR